MYAARGVVESAVKAYPSADMSVIIVRIPMLPSDNEAAARRASGMFEDARVQQFWDANRRSGIAYSRDVFPRWAKDGAEALPPDHTLCESLKSRADTPPEKRPLWDIALFYGSSGNSGKGGANLEEEVVLVAVAVGHSFDNFDLVVHALQQAGMQWILAVRQDAVDLVA